MRKVPIFLLIVGIVFLAGCSKSSERLLKLPNRDVVFSITVEKVPEGQPIPHTISAILPDGSVAARVPLYTGKYNQSKRFELEDHGTSILILARNGSRRTLWLVYTPSRARFEDTRNFSVMNLASVQAKVNIRDTTVFAMP